LSLFSLTFCIFFRAPSEGVVQEMGGPGLDFEQATCGRKVETGSNKLLTSFPAGTAGCPTSPISCVVSGSLNFMRLSLERAAQAVLSRAAYRKFGASRSFFARCGIPQASFSKPVRTSQLRTGALRSHQRCPDFLLRSFNNDCACGVLSKKAAWSRSTPPLSTGNPGYVGRKRWAKPHHSLSFRIL
jgi:hypothetical protein